ncbi:uncharacterized protein LOC105686008 isoform X1 [Athalia rosae]|uniref:uncharacterized protein LOC105686008 isoform X1 n=1 Tax=Athalia rosae TaxID=37344 RepID=UPI002034082C|nr:uncharacterized protein LOC105686008 isoform X1 [Athalia rosae]XP_048510989.1 uncharacterized protein LOC105686008 isoform X1 [Athalia rosae]
MLINGVSLPRSVARVFAIGVIILLVGFDHPNVTAVDIYNCKMKVRDMALKFCSDPAGIRKKRDISIGAEPESEVQRSRDLEIGDPRFGFASLNSGADLGLTLTQNEEEDLFMTLSQRLSRAAKNKNQTMRMINAFAAKCCGENRHDECNDAANVIACP